MPRDQHLMLPKSIGSREILAALQPNEHTLRPRSPLGQQTPPHTGVPVL